MHVLITRRAGRVAVALSVLLASGFAAQGLTPEPARAGVVCGGESCSVYLGAYIKLGGPDVSGSANPGISIPPPPCWYATVSSTYPAEGAPAGAAEPFDKFVHAAVKAGYGNWGLSDGGGGGGGGGYFSGIQGTADSVSGYPKYGHPAAGTWYGLDASGTAQGRACVGQRPWLAWVGAGDQPPPPEVPPYTLALYAYAHMVVPTLSVATNPQGRTYVSLPTFAETRLGGWGGNRDGAYPFQYVTATLKGTGESVTVWALAGHLVITSGAPDATVYDNCSDYRGSTWGSRMSTTGPGTAIDCGVTYRSPSTGGQFSLRGSITWAPTWAQGNAAGALPHGQPVGAADLYTTGARGVTVAEIQSLNGASGR